MGRWRFLLRLILVRRLFLHLLQLAQEFIGRLYAGLLILVLCLTLRLDLLRRRLNRHSLRCGLRLLILAFRLLRLVALRNGHVFRICFGLFLVVTLRRLNVGPRRLSGRVGPVRSYGAWRSGICTGSENNAFDTAGPGCRTQDDVVVARAVEQRLQDIFRLPGADLRDHAIAPTGRRFLDGGSGDAAHRRQHVVHGGVWRLDGE